MARTSGTPGEPGGATMFLVDADNPGMTMVRHIDTLDESLFGGHLEVLFDNCVVLDEAVLGAIGGAAAATSPRLPSADSLVQRYALVSGREPVNLSFYLSLGLATLRRSR